LKKEFDSDPSKYTQLTRTSNEIGSDLRKLSEMGSARVISNYNFFPGGEMLNELLDIAKTIANFAT
jgi:hypothetical protein